MNENVVTHLPAIKPCSGGPHHPLHLVQVDYITGRIGEEAGDNSLLYQALHFLITKVALPTFSPKPVKVIHFLSKGVDFVLPTILSASFGDPSAFTLGLIR